MTDTIILRKNMRKNSYIESVFLLVLSFLFFFAKSEVLPNFAYTVAALLLMVYFVVSGFVRIFKQKEERLYAISYFATSYCIASSVPILFVADSSLFRNLLFVLSLANLIFIIYLASFVKPSKQRGVLVIHHLSLSFFLSASLLG